MKRSFKFRKWHGLGFTLATVLVVGIAAITLLHPGRAKAAFFNPFCSFTILGRQGCDGYFTDQNFWSGDDKDPVLGNGVMPACPGCNSGFPDYTGQPSATYATEFEAEFQSYLSQSNNDTQYYYGAVGAAFIIDVMLGQSQPALCQWYTGTASTTCTWKAGVAYAQANFTLWETEINDYVAAGKVNWDISQTYPIYTPDTAHACTSGQATCIRAAPGQADPGDEMDLAWRGDPQYYIFDSIVFTNPDGTLFRLARQCGNIAGTFEPLAAPTDMDMKAYLGGVFDTAGNAVTSVIPGQTYVIHPSTGNVGQATSNTVYLEMATPAGTTNWTADPATLNPPYGIASGVNTNNCAAGYAITPPGVCQVQHWWWEYNNVPAGTTLQQQTAQFTVSATSGSICFQADVVHEFSADLNSYSQTAPFCIPVASPAYPSVVGQRSDVQAGGGLCDLPLSTTAEPVTGNNTAASGDQYVVAATGTISSFASNSGGTDTLKLGGAPAPGGYAAVCRPDLLTAAENGRGGANQGTIGGIGTVSVDLGCLTTVGANCGSTTGGAGVYYFGGSRLQLSGQINQKITIVATAGSVEITGPITISGANTTAATVPSLGVIADQNIGIDSGVTRVDAYLFAGNPAGPTSTINTCMIANGSLTTPCNVTTPVLDVNGFLMASNILFSRLGPAGSAGAVTAEDIAMNTELYLNPPAFFDEATVNGGLLQGQGERPPLF